MGVKDLKIPVSPSILTAVSRLDEFRGQWAAGPGVPESRLDRLSEAARIQSVAASCRLSGIRVSDNDVASLLRGESVQLHDAPEILGYAAAADYCLPAADKLLTSGDLKQMHARLLAGHESGPTPSPWRSVSHQREAFDAGGQATGRVFSTLPPRMIEEKLEDLLTWYEYEQRTGEQHSVLLVATFMLHFLAASPFDRFNGRMGRALAAPLLFRAGYGHMPYASLENLLEEMREQFHDAFDRAQTNLWRGEADLEPWLEMFLELLGRHRERVELKIGLERSTLDFPPLQQAILEVVREHGNVDAGLLIQATGANRNTLKDNLRRLVDRGLLEKTGQRRGTRYRLASPDRARAANGEPTPIDEPAG